MKLITDPAVLDGYLMDASNTRGHAEGLVRPASARELAAVLAHCQARGIPVTVTARRTSTTGAPVPDGGWLLSTERLDAVWALDDADGGVLLGAWQDEVERAGRLFTPDPTSRHECSLGGAIACNASGARSFRYGPTRPWVDWIEVALPTGDLVEATRDTPIPAGWPIPVWPVPHVKTAAGYEPTDNLLDLMIGQEGTLGVITRARVRLVDRPAGVLSLIAFFEDRETAVAFVERARAGAQRPGRPSEPGALNPRAVEYFDHNALALVHTRVPDTPATAACALFIEVEHDGEAPIEAWWDALADGGALADDVIVAEDDAGRARLHAVRHAVPAGVNEAVVRNGMPKVGTDFAVPDEALRAMMDAYEAVSLPHVTFGHIGDNHLHCNLLPRSADELRHAKALYRDLALLAVALGGTVSAEHGIGKLKRGLLAEMVGSDVLASFVALKRAADPAWILGRGTMLDAPGDSCLFGIPGRVPPRGQASYAEPCKPPACFAVVRTAQAGDRGGSLVISPDSGLAPLSTEREVVSRLQQGDRAAAADLYRWYGDKLYRQVILPRLPIPELAEDVLRDTFRTALERIDQYRIQDRSVFFWLRRIAINRAIDVHRAHQRTQRLEESVPPESVMSQPPPAPDRAPEVSETREQVELSLSRMNPRYALALRSRLIEELSRDECAARLGVTVANFDVILHRAAKAFRQVYPP